MKLVRPCLVLTVSLLLICSVVYPAVVTGLAQAIFPHRANGSLLERNGRVVGSELLGQTFEHPDQHPEYFWGRPSAASTDSATGVVYSSGSNYGPLNPTLRDEVAARVAILRATGITGPIPIDLVSKSASGLDPHISVASALIQVPRVARARHVDEATIRSLVATHTEGRTFGLLGEPRVNVLALNLALDGPRSPL